MFGGFFINLLIILIPIFFYQFVLLDKLLCKKRKNNNQWLVGFFFGLSSILCMIFPIVIGQGFLWDLRWVPFMMAILYGGIRGGAVAFVCLILYRLYVGNGPAFYCVLAVAVVIFAVLPRFRKTFHRRSSPKKVLLSIPIVLFTYLVQLAGIWWYFYYIGNFSFVANQKLWFFLFLSCTYVLGAVASVFLVENILENAKIREEIQRTEKLNLISQLAASIAHEVRNPLTVVRGFIQLAKDSMDEQVQSYMTTAIGELDRAEFIISDFLNFAKPQLENVEMVDVGQELKNVVNIITPFAIMQNVVVELEFAEGLQIRADKDKLKQVIMNLTKNSIEAMVNGGQVQIRASRKQETVVIQVIDNGSGMTEEQIERLGHPFYSTKEKGTGLGLMVTFRIVEAIGGKLSFASELGKGTEATIVLPLV